MNKELGLLSLSLTAVFSLSCGKLEQQESMALDASRSGIQSLSSTTSGWIRVFTDDFNSGSNLNNNWLLTSRADYNSSICVYDPSVPHIGNYDYKDVLVLTATKTGSTVKSGHVKSKFNFKPATNEEYRTSASIKLIALEGETYRDFAQTYGAWPAFWTVEENGWPTKGEIDIMEAYSYGSYAHFASNLFYGTSVGTNLLGNSCERPYTASSGWHLYDEYWKNDNGHVTVVIQLDGNTVAEYSNASHENLQLQNFGPHNVILNLNVGSDGDIFNNGLINLFSKTMMWVDYVTVDKRTL